MATKSEYPLTQPLDLLHLQCYSQSHQLHGSQPFHDSTVLFHHSIPEAINGGMVSGGGSSWQLFLGMAGNYGAGSGFVNSAVSVKLITLTFSVVILHRRC